MVIILYALWSFLYLAFTINVFRPYSVPTQARATFLSFLFSWLFGDLAFHWILLDIIIVCAFWQFVGLSGHWEELLTALHLVCWFALTIRIFFLFELRELSQRQLESALGEDFEKRILPELIVNPKSESKVDWKLYWNPMRLLQDPKIKWIQDIVFYEEPGIRLKLDIFCSKDRKSHQPVLLQIHGGGWTIGTKNQGIPLMVRMAKQGWACVAITYRLSPKAIFPDHIIDCKRAIHWIQKNAEEYGFDSECVFVTGGSAGGHLAALTALTGNYKPFQPNFEEVDTSIQGCVAFYGVYNWLAPFSFKFLYPLMADLLKMVTRTTPEKNPTTFESASPFHHITKEAPPFLVIQGETDALIPMHEAEEFYQKLKDISQNNVGFLKLPLLEHAFDNLPTVPTQMILPTIEKFLLLTYSDFLRTKK